MLKLLLLFILLFYVIPTIISFIGEVYASHYHDYETFFNLDLNEKLRDAKTVGDYLYCFQNNFVPVANILFMLMYICMFLYDFLKWLFKFITKITKLDILWKKIMNIKIRK
jgi:hypothetical protein